MSNKLHTNDEDDGISALRAKLQKDASKFLKGVTNNDVDWFLRGGNIDNNQVKSPLLNSVDMKSSATVASDESHVLLKQKSESPSTPPSIDASNTNKQSQDTSNRLQRSKTLDDVESPYALQKTSTNISQKSDTQPRSRSYSISSLKKASEPKEKKGFFKKLFNSSGDSKQPPTSPPPSSSPRLVQPVGSPKSVPATPSSPQPAQQQHSAVDPKLEEYLKYYRRRQSLSAQQQQNIQSSSTLGKSSAIAASASSSNVQKVDLTGAPIPAHPDISPLPSAITNFAGKDSLNFPNSTDSLRSQQSQSKFGLLRRHHSTFTNKNHTPTSPVEDEDDYATHISSSNVANKEARIPPITYLQKMEPLRKVAFAAEVFVCDPPQQIPSRHPRKGNVEVLKDGTIKINLLDEEEKKKILTQSGGGVVVGGSGHLRSITPEDRRDSEQEEAKERAKNHTETASDDSKFLHKNEVQIDKPMVSRHKQYDENGHYIMDSPIVKLQLDELYTRCCHLREILPIPAILKQIPKGTTSPLLILQLRNPRPSLIEILAFSDFIRIAPIICISLDGVQLSEQMFRIILSALVFKKHLEKLSLRNTPINAEGWKLLCWFLSVNKRLRRLDLTQCPSLSVNTQKLRDPSKLLNIERMECNRNNRSDMDWSLMNATLIARGGIEDIILSGCKIKEFDVFKNFVEMVVGLMTVKLGLAYNDLSLKQIEVVAKSLKDNDKLLGLDVGYNDLSLGLVHFINYSDKHYETSNLLFLSLNSTNLKFNETTKKLIPALSRLKSLKFLDLSNNKQLFPKINDYLFSYFPLFPNLVRLHLESNDLDSKGMVMIAETMTLCPHLNYMSLVGNHLDSVVLTSLVNAMKISKTIFNLDLDYDQVPSDVKEKIGLYTMRNMEQVLYSTSKDKTQQQQASKGADNISFRMYKLLQSNDLTEEHEKEVEKFMIEASKIKAQITETIAALFKLQGKGQLNIEGKESLIRLCFIDSALEKGVSLIGSRFKHVPVDISKYTAEQLNAESADKVMKYGQLDDDEPELNLDDDIELKPDNFSDKISITKTPSSKSLKDMDKAEGSVLKLGSLMSHHDIDKFEKTISLNDEEIKKVLLNPVDLHLVTEVLTQVKRQGISLEDVFKKSSSLTAAKDIPKNQQLNLDNLRKKLKSLKLDQISSSDVTSSSSSSNSLTDQNTQLNKRQLDSGSSNEDIGENTSADNESLQDVSSTSEDVDFSPDDDGNGGTKRKDEGESDAINQAYDSLLSDLVKVKTNTN